MAFFRFQLNSDQGRPDTLRFCYIRRRLCSVDPQDSRAPTFLSLPLTTSLSPRRLTHRLTMSVVAIRSAGVPHVALRLLRSRKFTSQYIRAVAMAFGGLLLVNARSLPLVWHSERAVYSLRM